jgi:hypothetical protein
MLFLVAAISTILSAGIKSPNALGVFSFLLQQPQQVCSSTPSCETLFNYATGAVAFLFIIACILVFVFIYDNMRRGRRVAAT